VIAARALMPASCVRCNGGRREESVLPSKSDRLIPTGMLMLSGGLILHNWMYGRYTEFGGGFLIGMSLVFLIAGFVQQSKGLRH
jgi:hypothetical protein